MTRLSAEIVIGLDVEGLDRLRDGVSRLLEPGTMQRLVAAAMQESFVRAYARRFEAAVKVAKELFVEKDPLAIKRLDQDTEEFGLARVTLLERQLAQASSERERAVVQSQIDRLSQVLFETAESSRLRGETGLGTGVERKDESGLSGTADVLWLYRRKGGALKGQFSKALESLKSLIGTPEQLAPITLPGGQIGVGFLDVSRLDQIKTPTASPQTKSRMNILWRHVEFGTGLFRKRGPEVINVAAHQAGGGAWWYPRGRQWRNPGPLKVRGSYPGNFVKTAAGLPFETDSLLFFPALTTRIARELRA